MDSEDSVKSEKMAEILQMYGDIMAREFVKWLYAGLLTDTQIESLLEQFKKEKDLK